LLYFSTYAHTNRSSLKGDRMGYGRLYCGSPMTTETATKLVREQSLCKNLIKYLSFSFKCGEEILAAHDHVFKCRSCAKQIQFYVRVDALHYDHFCDFDLAKFWRIAWMRLEINELRGSYPYLGNVCPKILNPTGERNGAETIQILTESKWLTEHLLHCSYCQLIRQYYWQEYGNHGRIAPEDWGLFPVFHPEDKVLENLRANDREWIEPRIAINYYLDKEVFRAYTQKPRWVLKMQHWWREQIDRRIGSFISSWRITSNPFSPSHPRYVWQHRDKIIRLVLAHNLNKAEQLYRDILSGKESLATNSPKIIALCEQ